VIQFSKMPTALVLDPDMTVSAVRAWHVIYTETLGRPGWDLSYAQIAKKIRSSRRTTVYAVGLLMKKGWIKQIPSNKGPGAPNLYVALSEPEVPVGGATSCTRGGATSCTRGGAKNCTRGSAKNCTHRETHIPGDSLPEDKSRRPSGDGDMEDAKVGKYGNLSDDVDMPEPEVGKRPKRPFKSAPPVGTHFWARDEFERLMVKTRCGGTRTTRKKLDRTFRLLREEGYTNEEIVIMVRAFFTRYAQEIRAKRMEIDPSVMFQQRLPQLKAQKKEEIESMRAGTKTSSQIGTELNRDARKRLGLTEEESA